MRFFFAFLAVAVLGSTAPAQAAFLVGNSGASQSGLGRFAGSISYAASGATSATLTVTLTNTSPVANGGYLTGFVLNNPGNAIRGVTLTTSRPNFGTLGSAPFANGTLNASPYGEFAFGAGTGNNFEGGGPPARGLAVGETGTFVFALTGTGLDTLSDASFLNTPSSGPNGGAGYQPFVARFRGFNDNGSAKVPAMSPVPEPPSLALSGLALLAGSAGFARRRRRPPIA